MHRYGAAINSSTEPLLLRRCCTHAISPMLAISSGASADVMESLHIPRGVRRVLFWTLDTDRLFCSLIYFVQEIIIVESFKLDSIKPGICSLHCLPLRLRGAEGSSPWDIPEQTLFSPPVLLLRRGVTL
ncbi:hypothetical protein GW17_00036646 [Ensete ventricosum]|nr:hypothetical protein GW17_00036646 [Ensete ventricosum]